MNHLATMKNLHYYVPIEMQQKIVCFHLNS